MNLAEILIEVRKLSPDEKEVVVEAIRLSDGLPSGLTPDERRDELFRRLQAKGMLSEIPNPRATPGDFEPVSIKGRPLSETIIEDRR